MKRVGLAVVNFKNSKSELMWAYLRMVLICVTHSARSDLTHQPPDSGAFRSYLEEFILHIKLCVYEGKSWLLVVEIPPEPSFGPWLSEGDHAYLPSEPPVQSACHMNHASGQILNMDWIL